MSASPEKKAQRDEKRRQEEQKDRRTNALYTVIAVVVVVAAAALMVWRSGVIQRGMTALTVDGTKYTASDVQYYYTTLYSNHANRYDFLPSTSVKDQVYDQETGQSWHDYLLEEAVKELAADTALAARANQEGYVLSTDAQIDLDTTLNQLDTIWISSGAASRDAFIHSNFGPYMTYDKLVSLIRQEILASDYANTQLEDVDHPESDYEAYYQENVNTLDTIIYTQLAFQATVAADEQGNAVEMTDEEKAAALEEQKTAKKALAEEVQAKLEAGEDPEALAEEYADELYSTAISRRTTAYNAGFSTYADWLLDSSRKSGDITLTEQETSDSCYYYVALFEDRFRDEEETHSVRHILVRAGDGTADPTQEEYDEAEKAAQALLDEWEAGEATESSFAALAAANSADTGSASSGGLISGITSNSSYVEAFLNWSVAPSRKPGDTELVKTEYGWHVMYYVSTDDPAWRLSAVSALRSEDYEQMAEEAVQNCTVSQGTGMKFVTAA